MTAVPFDRVDLSNMAARDKGETAKDRRLEVVKAALIEFKERNF